MSEHGSVVIHDRWISQSVNSSMPGCRSAFACLCHANRVSGPATKGKCSSGPVESTGPAISVLLSLVLRV